LEEVEMTDRRTWLFGLAALVPLALAGWYAAASPVSRPALAETTAASCCTNASCCPDGACCPDGPCCLAPATAAVARAPVKAADCCPDDDCCPSGSCCSAAKAPTTKATDSCCPPCPFCD
jgi:hypothetical protein